MEDQVLAGTVQSGTGGSMPLAGVPVTLYRATEKKPIAVGSATTGKDGGFSIPVADPSSDTVFYASAEVSRRVRLVAVIGTEVRGPVIINELTTVAAAFSFAQFCDGKKIAGSAFGLRIAAGMNDNLVDPLTGQPSPVLLSPPNADETNALRSTRSLANLVAACVRGTHGVEVRFLALATPPGGRKPGDTFHALWNIARNPTNNAGTLFNQSQGVPTIFSPPLFGQPDAWTLAVKVNDSGDDDYLIGGPANIAFDRNGYAWIANNVFQGTPDSGNFIFVLQPDGRPARGGDGLPMSPVFGGGLKGPGWGITIDPGHHVWVGNFGWGAKKEMPHHGSVSEFRHDGTPVSGEHGYHDGGIDRVQATVSDAEGNIWMASFGSNEVVVYLRGDPHHHRSAPAGEGTFGIAVARDGTVWVSAGGGGLGWPRAKPGSVARFRLEGGELKALQKKPTTVGAANKAIAVDSLGNAWLASGGDSSVYQLDRDGKVTGTYTGVGGMDAPWGICVDGDDHVWVGNFGVLGPESDYTYPGLTQLVGANLATAAPGAKGRRPDLSPHRLHAAQRGRAGAAAQRAAGVRGRHRVLHPVHARHQLPDRPGRERVGGEQLEAALPHGLSAGPGQPRR